MYLTTEEVCFMGSFQRALAIFLLGLLFGAQVQTMLPKSIIA